MKYGLKTDEIHLIKELLRKYFGDISDVKVVIFGSRAKDNYKPYSDIDLAIQTKDKNISKRILSSSFTT